MVPQSTSGILTPSRTIDLPSQKELRWSQLKVGILALVALIALTALIFLMSGSTGGLFTPKLNLISYFTNANGVKVGAPVTLDGVTIGNVTKVQIVPNHEPDAVQITSRVSAKYVPQLHTDSVISIKSAGVLGDSFVDISSVRATGPPVSDGATLKVANTPQIQDVISTSQDALASTNQVIQKIGVLVDNINAGKGTAGMLLNDPVVARKLALTIDQLQKMVGALASGKGSLGKLINDDELYTKANSTINQLNSIVAALDKGQGTAGKLLKDEALYNNLNAAIANTNELLTGINSGKGSLGKLAKDPALATKVEESITRLNTILKGLEEGQGSLGQMVVNRSLYDNLDKTLNDTGQLITAIRKDPKTYLTIRVKVF
jgi:phospholipid/cholesterol/gamma-HCH transport system substrate-binding protein